MSKVVVFTIGNGNFEEGFPVTLRIREENGNVHKEEVGELPAAPDIPLLYQEFRKNYTNLDAVRVITRLEQRGFDVDPNQTTNVSTPDECREAGKALEARLVKWFEHPSMGQLRVYVEEEVGKEESARIIFQTSNEILKKLPWHLWRLFQNRKGAWLSLGAKYNSPAKPLQSPVKILTVLGNDDKINVNKDGKIISSLPGSKVELLKQPSRRELCERLRNSYCDILCFAGHSATSSQGNDGIIQLNNIDSPALKDLKNAFITAIENGLKLAIFNSCDGLGLANKLTELNIRQVIVMREPVPDEVAQQFLQDLLLLFSQGEKFHIAVRKAQEKLEDIEYLYPYASWLPIICQNPAEKSLHWRQPTHVKIKRAIKKLWRVHKVAALASLILIGAIAAILVKQIFLPPPTQPIQNITSTPLPTNTIAPESTNSLDKLFSRGEKILLKTNSNKDAGKLAFQQSNWNKAINDFSSSLKQTPNDPESLIYLNNAIAAKTGQNNIHIAVSVPITKNSNVAEEILRGVAHAQSKVNCGSVDKIIEIINSNQTPTCTGSINNRQLQVEIVDDGNDHPTTIQVARKLVNDNNQQDIIAVIGHYRSELTKAAVNQGYMNNMLVVSPTSTSTELSSLPYPVLRTVPSDSNAIANLNKYILSKIPLKSIRPVIAYDRGESYCESIKDKFLKVINQPNIPSYDLKTDGAEQIIREAQKINANVLLLVPSGTEDVLDKALEVVKEASNTPNNQMILLGASVLYSPATISKDNGLRAEQTKLITAVPWQRSESTANSSNFEKESDKIWGGAKINWVTVMSYDAVQVITKGLSTITTNPTRLQLKDNILNNIEKFTTVGATATIEFDTQEEKGSRKPISTGNRVGVLVKVQCQNSTCNFIEENL